jgi:hypothetical protein
VPLAAPKLGSPCALPLPLHYRTVNPPHLGQSLKRRSPGWWNSRGFKEAGGIAPDFFPEMRKERAKKLLKDWWKPVFLEFLKGAAKALGFILLSQLLG